jgi:hypothetical protein
MKLLLERRPTVQSTTFGRLSIDGSFQCYTLEDAIREVPGASVADWKVKHETAIPAGTYDIVLVTSPRFGKNTLSLVSVPGFDLIRIHEGNDDGDTDGCILVGQQIVEMADDGGNLLESRKALAVLKARVVAAIRKGEHVTIEVRNP